MPNGADPGGGVLAENGPAVDLGLTGGQPRDDRDDAGLLFARYGITPQTEVFKMSEVNKAMDHLRAGKARYRVVLDYSLGF